MPSINISFTITAIIALIALISPIFVTIINNRYQIKLKQIELNNNIQQKKFETYYIDKSNAFRSFLNNAGQYCSNYWKPEFHALMLSSLENALLFCECKTSTDALIAFSLYVNNKFSTLRNDNKNIEDILELSSKISELSIKLNQELLNTIS